MQKNVKILFILLVVLIGSMGTVSADSVNSTANTTVLPNYSNIYVQTANDEGISFNTTGNGTYYIQSLNSTNGGFNAVHIANNSSATLNYGSYTTTSNQSGTFYATDTGGRGYQDDVILMVAVNGTIPDDFVLHITASGYNWTPTGVMNAAPTTAAISNYGVTLNETFTKDDFIYGPQSWKPTGGNANYPIYLNEDVNDTSNMFYIMFIDLHAGLLGSNYQGGNSQFVDNGAVKIDYSFENLASLAAFNIYAWNWNTSQGQGMLWTNSIKPGNTGGPSGYAVLGATSPAADFSTSTTTDPLTVQFTDKSTGAEPLTYLWDFGDGTTSTDENPVHSYSNPGNYSVKLSVNNSYGSSEKTSSVTASVLQVLADLSSGLYNSNQTVNLTASDQLDPSPKIYYTLDGTDPTTNSTLYTGSIVLKEGTTILKFKAFDSYGYSSEVVTRNYTLDETPPTVTATPSGGTYNTLQNVTLTTSDATSTKTYYTTDGTDPKSSTTRTLYSSPIAVYTNTSLEFAAVDAASNWSPVYIQNYTMVDTAAPVLSVDLPDGSYTSDQVAKLSAVDEMDPSPKIYYTLDGTDPTTNSTLYTWPISINIVGTTVLKAIAVDDAGNISDILTRIYALDKPAVSGTWNSTTIDSNSMYNSIAIDSLGNPHIAYYQKANSATDYPKLKYAYRDSSGWHIETVDSTQSGAGYYVSLALDSSGNPHLVYKQEFGDGNTNMLKYAYKDADGWHYVTLATSYAGNTLGDDIVYIDLVMYKDQPRISFYNITGGEVEYMYNNGTSWVTENVASTSAPWNSLAVDSSGNPKISFCSVSAASGKSSLRYAQRTADGTWQTKIVDNSADNVGEWNSLALDSSGNPWISYAYNGESLNYAYWNGTQWVTGTVDNLTASASKIVLTSSNSPLIVYRDDTSSNLKYAYMEGSTWSTSNIDSVNGAYLWISLALDASGVPNVSYMTSNSKLNYAYLVPFILSADPAGGTFNATQTVNLTSTPGTTVYYTTDGSDPRISSTKTKYSTPILVNNTTTIRFAAVDSADNWSSIYSETYIVNINSVTDIRTNKTYTNIQDAINDTDTQNGDTLTVTGGTYTENVVVSKQLIIKGSGSVVVNPSDVNSPTFLINGAGSGTVITGLIINGGYVAVNLVNAENCTISNNTLSNNTYGLLMEYSNHNNVSGNDIVNNTNAGAVSRYWSDENTIQNNTFVGNGYGLHLLYSSNNNVSGNKISNNTFYGIYADNSQNNTFENNNITGNPYAGVALYFSASNSIFSNNTVMANGFGIYSYESDQNTIKDSNISKNTFYGVYLDGSNENLLENDTIQGNPYAGVALYFSAGNNTILSNTVTGNGFGVYIYSSNGNIIESSNVSANTYGVYLDTSNQNILANNTIEDNPYAGVAMYFSSDANTVENNTLSGNGFGIYGYESSGDGSGDIVSNNITGNAFYGIYLDNCSNMEITNNTVSNNQYAGISVYNGSKNNTLMRNNINNNGFGVYIESSTNNSLYTNNFTDNTVQAYDNGTNVWDDGTQGNYYSDWTTTATRSIVGGTNTDNHPSTTQFT